MTTIKIKKFLQRKHVHYLVGFSVYDDQVQLRHVLYYIQNGSKLLAA